MKFAAILILIFIVAFIQGLSDGTEELIRQEQQARIEQHAVIYEALAKCLNGATLMVGNEPVAECKKVKRW